MSNPAYADINQVTRLFIWPAPEAENTRSGEKCKLHLENLALDMT